MFSHLMDWLEPGDPEHPRWMDDLNGWLRFAVLLTGWYWALTLANWLIDYLWSFLRYAF
jgi:hypothetical protein